MSSDNNSKTTTDNETNAGNSEATLESNATTPKSTQATAENNQAKGNLAPCESLSVDDRLFRTRFKADTDAHLVVDPAICRTCTHKGCTYVCPVQNYTINDENDVIVSWEGCLECGACRVACTPGGLTWKYPNGGMGVCLRKG